MTIDELCKTLHTSRATLYRRAKAAGYELSTMRNDDGTLSAQGAAQLAALFDDVATTTTETTPRATETDDDTQGGGMETGDDALIIAELRAQNDALRQQLDIVKMQADDLRRQRDAWQQQAADALALSNRLLPASTPTATSISSSETKRKRQTLKEWLAELFKRA